MASHHKTDEQGDDAVALPAALEAGIHPSIIPNSSSNTAANTSQQHQVPPPASSPSSSSATTSRARSTSRGRTGAATNSNPASSDMVASTSDSINKPKSSKSPLAAGQTLALPRSGGPSNIPLPSPSAVHINQSLEDSLRRGEEERLRRSAERRERRRRRIQQSKQSQARKASTSTPAASGGKTGAEGGGGGASHTIPGSTSIDDDKDILHEDDREGDQSIDSVLPDEDSALVTTPTIPIPSSSLHRETQQAGGSSTTTPLYTPQAERSSGDEQEYYDEGDEDYDSEFDGEEEEEDGYDGRSLTRQLAETAVSVREMSRELGRARVKSNIQSVLIVTKARDNQLIKLTREVALYLMKTPRYGRNRGLVVYVDSQLKKSKRFDAAGMEKENPELFRSPHHHHHHHHSHSNPSHGHPQGSVSGGTTPRRNSSRRTSSNSASSLNLLGMTAASTSSTTTNSSSTSDRGYFSNPSGYSSGASTPAQTQGGKPMTKLTEALVSRQIDRQLEKENARRMSQSQAQSQNQSQSNGAEPNGRAPGQKVAFAAGTASVDGSSTPSQQQSGEDHHGLLRYWTAEMCSKSPHLFDLVITLGGDGTVLFTSWLFQHVVPPVIPFALGSLGFLTNFDFSNYKEVLESAINEGVRVNLRMRFTATIYRAVNDEEEMADANGRTRVVRSGETGQLFMESSKYGAWENIEGGHVRSGAGGAAGPCAKDKEVRCSVTRPVESFEVLNDLVVDRGPSPYVSLLELFGDEHHMTTVQADGLCVATPTGSTAYSLSAGGSLVHPEIPTLLITPICPHTLSFRPMLLPDSMELRIVVPYNSRSTAWASFDGRGRVELRQGDHIKVTASTYPFPTVCADKQSTDWFQAITRTLKWNERQRQKSFVVLEHDRKEPHDAAQSKAKAEKGYAVQPASSRVDTSINITSTADDDDDEGFDIDDISSDPSPTVGAGASVPTSKQSTGSKIKPADRSGAHNERQSGPPTIHLSGRSGSRQESNDDNVPTSPNEHDYSHSSAQHLRQYATYPKDSYGGARSPRDRTPKTAEAKTPTARDWASNATLPSRARSGSKKSTRFQVNNDDHVKAFVVFGADSSDVDTSASEDD